MTLLAHAGHWLPQLLYLAPVLAVAAFVAWEAWKGRRERGGRSPRSRARDAEREDAGPPRRRR